MKFGFDTEIADLEAEVMSKNYTAEGVFGERGTGQSPSLSPNRIAEQRRNWRPVERGDIKVEVRKSRHLPIKK